MATHENSTAGETVALELTRDEAQLLVKSLAMTRNGRRFEFRTGDGKEIEEQASFLKSIDDLSSRLQSAFK